MAKLTLSTKLTLSRPILGLLAIAFLYLPVPYGAWISLVLFLIGVLTDFLDGKLARSRGEVSSIGIFLDPLTDKLFVLSMMIALIDLWIFPFWAVILVLFRELIVTSFRDYAVAKGISVPSVMSGKIKSTLQFIAIALALLALAIYVPHVTRDIRWTDVWSAWILVAAQWVLIASILVGYWGMFVIFKNNLRRVVDAKVAG